MPCNHLILCHPFLLLPSIFPSIRVFPNEPVLRIRWSKYWSFSISPSSEYSGLISENKTKQKLVHIVWCSECVVCHPDPPALLQDGTTYFPNCWNVCGWQLLMSSFPGIPGKGYSFIPNNWLLWFIKACMLCLNLKQFEGVIPAPWLQVGSTEAFVVIAHSLTSPPPSYPQAWLGFPYILQGVDLINMCQQTSGM